MIMAEKKVKPEKKSGIKSRVATQKKKIEKTSDVNPEKENVDGMKKEIDPWKVLLYPHMAEKSMSLVDLQNKLVFVVRRDASKPEIKASFEKLFSVKVQSVQTETAMQGQKKAFIKLHPDNSAADIATRLGIL